MDSDCERLVEEMWQSYLCEENLDSFYETSTFGPLLNPTQSGTETPDQQDIDLVNAVLGVEDGWEPLEDIFGLLEEILCEGQDVELDQQETPKQICKNTTTENVNPTLYNKNETENNVINSNHKTSKPQQSKRKRSKITSDHNGKQKKKKAANKK